MTLQTLDLLRTRAADGLAEAEEVEVLRAAGVDPAEHLALRWLLAEALGPAASRGLAGDVMAALGVQEPRIGAALRGAMGPVPAVADGVMAAVWPEGRKAAGAAEAESVPGALGLGEDAVGAALREGAGPAPELSGAVLRALGLGEDAVGAALREGAGAGPELSGAVLGALGLSVAPVAEALQAAAGPAPALVAPVQAQVAPGRPQLQVIQGGKAAPVAPAPVHRSSYAWPLGALLAVAAALILFIGLPAGPVAVPVAAGPYEFAAINQVEIEDLEAGPNAMVQVFQAEENAPTIIFLEPLDEVDPTASEGGGATL